MLNWNTDEKTFKKKDPKAYKLWRLTQMINYGLDGERISKKELKEAWPKIKERLNPDKQHVIEFLLWDKKWKTVPGLLPDRSNYWSLRFKNPT